MYAQEEEFSDQMGIPTFYLLSQKYLDCTVLEMLDSLRSHAETFGLCRYAKGLTLNTL